MAKKILLSICSIFLVFRSVELFNFLNNSNPNQFNWALIIGISFALNLFITGIFAFLGFAFCTSKVLPNSYYRIKNHKKLILIYKLIGVNYFKLFLLKFFWGKEKNRKRYFNGTKMGIFHFETQTKQSEFGHLVAFITILIVSLIILIKGHYSIFILTTIINFISNFYPILLQRMHRIQIERIKVIVDKRKSDI